MKTRIIVLIIVAIVIGIPIIYFIFFQLDKSVSNQAFNQNQNKCLDENKEVSYKMEEKNSVLVDVMVSVNDKLSKRESLFFNIEDVYKNSSSIVAHKCGFYVIRFLNYNSQKSKQDPGFKAELWKYKYNKMGSSLITLSEKKENNLFIGNYSYNFRIDHQEKYLILEKGYLGKDDYSLVIKDLNTKEDVFVLLAKDIVNQYPNVVGNFGLDAWTDDDRYFWGDIFDGAYSVAYFRIDTRDWKYTIFEAPDGSMGGMPFNINTGYVPLQPGLVWTGDVELTEDIKKRDRNEGKKSSLYLYNVSTKEKILIETTDEPQFFFKPEWLSDTELQYEMPSDEKKVYKIKPITPTKTYINAKFSYKFQYPESLILSEKNFENYIFTDSGDTCKNLFQEESRPRRPLSQTSLIDPSTKFNVEVVTIDVYENENNLSLDDWLNSGTKFLEKYSEECKYNDKNYMEIRLDNKKRVIINDTSGVEGFTGCCMTSNKTIYLNKNNRIYEISFSGSINDGLKCIPFSDNKYSCPTISEDMYNQILASFKFLE